MATLETLEQNIAGIAGAVTGIQKSIVVLQADVTTLKNDVYDLKETVDDHSVILRENTVLLEDLDTRFTASLEPLKSHYTFEDQIDDHEHRIEKVEDEQTKLHAAVKDLHKH